MKLHTLTIVGVGLIGGSIGLAAKRRGLAARVLGVGRHPASLEQSLKRGAIDQCFLDLPSAVVDAEMVVFCTPVDRIADQVIVAASHCAAGTILTDAGSTKAAIVRAVEGRVPGGAHFIGSHPLAGSEKRGPQYADPDLFQDRLTILTPTPATDPAAVKRVTTFWKALGCRIRCMDPDEHDRSLALTSHLPHLLASALAGLLPPELHDLTAGGFRDTTRIAAGDPSIWTGIFAQNRNAVLDALHSFKERLAEYRQALDNGDEAALRRLWSQAKKVRDALGS
jgi:prephenate dehydrogenase